MRFFKVRDIVKVVVKVRDKVTGLVPSKLIYYNDVMYVYSYNFTSLSS